MPLKKKFRIASFFSFMFSPIPLLLASLPDHTRTKKERIGYGYDRSLLSVQASKSQAVACVGAFPFDAPRQTTGGNETRGHLRVILEITHVQCNVDLGRDSSQDMGRQSAESKGPVAVRVTAGSRGQVQMQRPKVRQRAHHLPEPPCRRRRRLATAFFWTTEREEGS